MNKTVEDLISAYGALNKVLGKRTLKELEALVAELELSPEASDTMDMLLLEWEASDTFAGYGRADGLVTRVDLTLRREFGFVVNK